MHSCDGQMHLVLCIPLPGPSSQFNCYIFTSPCSSLFHLISVMQVPLALFVPFLPSRPSISPHPYLLPTPQMLMFKVEASLTLDPCLSASVFPLQGTLSTPHIQLVENGTHSASIPPQPTHTSPWWSSLGCIEAPSHSQQSTLKTLRSLQILPQHLPCLNLPL